MKNKKAEKVPAIQLFPFWMLLPIYSNNFLRFRKISKLRTEMKANLFEVLLSHLQDVG